MQTLSQKLQVSYPLCNENLYDSVLNKLTLYNRNVKYINEGYTKLPTHITFSKDEQQAVSEMLFALQFNYLENYFVETYENNINESFADIKQKFKEAIEKGKNSVEEFFKDLIDKIPDSVKEAYQKLGELAKKGISNAKDLLTKLYKIFSTLGETLSEALEKLGIYKKSIVNEIDENEFIEDIPDELLPDDESKRKVAKFLISRVHKGLQNKEVISYAKINDTKDVNEGKAGRTAAVVGLGIISQFSLLPVVLIAGGYLTYNALKFIGPKLSDKLEPYLLSDKTKEFVSKLYDNPISRYGLGLQKNSDIDSEDTKLFKFFKICKSILINLVISYLISSFVGLFISGLFSGALGAVGVSILVASILAGRNIMSTVFNRILNFKKETTVKTKNGEKKVTNKFFDLVTLVSILASLMSVLLQIPAVKEWFADLAKTGLANSASAAGSSDKLLSHAASVGYFDKDGNFHKYKHMETILQGEKFEQIPVLNPTDNNYYVMGKDGVLEMVPWKKMIRTGAVQWTEVGSFTGSKVGMKALKDVEGWSGVHIMSFTTNSSKAIENELGHGIWRKFDEFCNCVQCLTTESGETFVCVTSSRDIESMCKTCFQTAATYSSERSIIHHVFNIDELGGNFKELIGNVTQGPSYDAFDKLLDNKDFIEKAVMHAIENGKEDIMRSVK